ncbi:hypothetical protein [uncultured Eubacterium sp.]|uniref:hypothetical protein n=1 Tax=uncultured Eubacterium sp. TaxID=165185 RepID=UPI002595EC19|nr:hypothetical protein [uncultured Eubacterium sp.]
MNNKLFKDISIRGRVAYSIKCLQIYTTAKYPNVNYKEILDFASRITDDSDYIDESAMAYMEIIPEYLYEFNNYLDADFDYITEEQFNNFRNIISNNDEELNKIMKSIYDITMEYCYEAMEPGAPRTLPYLKLINEILINNSLSLPDINNFISFSFNINDGWGKHIKQSEYL